MLPILVLISLFVIVLIQDVRHRGVYWILFPLVCFTGVWMRYNSISVIEILYNVAFIVLLMTSLTVYVSLRQGKLTNITKGFFSWGDILFLIAITPLFKPYSFILLFTVGTFLTLILHLIASMFSVQKTIPYAGYMSIACSLFLLIENNFQFLSFN